MNGRRLLIPRMVIIRSFFSSPREESEPDSIVDKGVIVAVLSPGLSSSLSKAQDSAPSNMPLGKLFIPEDLCEDVLLKLTTLR